MDIKLYNTLTREKAIFEPIKKGRAGVYSCGPTVYQRPHIGNYRAFIFADTLRRVLQFNKLEVNHVMNITDVGHLVADSDDGEDKIAKQALLEGKTAWDIAKMYTDMFLEDMKELRVGPFTHMPKATDHIEEQIAMIQTLEEKGFAYRTADGVYFDTAKLPDYGILSGQKLEEKQEGARVAVNVEKHNPTDFALWKLSPEGEQRHMEWASPWGVGFPGWHIECSAMSEKYLGSPFDIHTGGIDHIPVHHTNEIAQTEGARGNKEANYWMHLDFLRVDNQKMSKSLGNVYSLEDIKAKGFSAMDLRYFFLGAHYRSSLNFTWESLEAAQTALRRLENFMRRIEHLGHVQKEYVEKFQEAVNDDLNTPRGLAIIWEVMQDDALAQEDKAATILAMDEVFGLGLADFIGKKETIPSEVQELVEARQSAREAKDFKKSDELRDAIAAQGFIVKDTAGGQTIEKA